MVQKNFTPFFGRPKPSAQVYCALCLGELYPGDGYYLLEDRRICDICLERYAQRYFAPQHRRLGGHEMEVQ